MNVCDRGGRWQSLGTVFAVPYTHSEEEEEDGMIMKFHILLHLIKYSYLKFMLEEAQTSQFPRQFKGS
jgi:hypothetical protein